MNVFLELQKNLNNSKKLFNKFINIFLIIKKNYINI